MQYMGGKFRQRRAIADALRPYIDGDTTYVEPFLGGGWSFAHVIDTCKPGHAIGAGDPRLPAQAWGVRVQ